MYGAIFSRQQPGESLVDYAGRPQKMDLIHCELNEITLEKMLLAPSWADFWKWKQGDASARKSQRHWKTR